MLFSSIPMNIKDLNFVTDPFTPEDRSWLANKLNGRLAPIVERSFGIFRGAIRANDVSLCRDLLLAHLSSECFLKM